MTEVARVEVQLGVGDATQRLQRLALSSTQVRESWGHLPASVQHAHAEMLRLTQVHTRLGYLRGEERRSVRLHSDYVRQHQTAVQRHAERLHQMAMQSPHLSRYMGLEATGGLGAAIETDPAIAHLHRTFGARDAAHRQLDAMEESGDFFARAGLSGGFNLGEAASFYGRRALFGAGPDGAPRTPGEWAKHTAMSAVNGAVNTARQVSGMLALFEGYQMLTRSMDAYEKKAETVQEMGARMGGNFDDVSTSLDLLRRRFKYVLGEIRPGLQELQRLTGEGAGPTAHAALAFARGAMPTNPGAVLSAYAHARIFGGIDEDLMERGLRASGMRARPEAFLGIYGAAQSGLGHGFFDVPSDLALRYTTLVGRTFGGAYMNSRGEDFIGRLLGGMSASGSDVLEAMKFTALEGMPEFDLGNGVKAGGSGLRGIRKALQSGDPRVLERFFRMAVQHGGGGELGRDWFEALLPGVRPHEVDALFDVFQRSGGRMPTADEIRKAAPNLDADRLAVEGTEAYRQQKLASEMELDVYEKLGPSLMATAHDVRSAAMHFVQGLTGVMEMTQAFGAMLDDLMLHPAGGNLTRAAVGVQVQQHFGWMGAAGLGAVTGGAKLREVVPGIWDAMKEHFTGGATPSGPHTPPLPAPGR